VPGSCEPPGDGPPLVPGSWEALGCAPPVAPGNWEPLGCVPAPSRVHVGGVPYELVPRLQTLQPVEVKGQVVEVGPGRSGLVVKSADAGVVNWKNSNIKLCFLIKYNPVL
jgi:hypothetical protein